MEGGFDPSDERLVSSTKDGNLDAFNSLVERYQAAVFTLCLRLLGDRQSAEDAAQEAFISGYRAIAQFREGSVRAWLLRIAANECKDELRRRTRKDASASLDAMLESDDGPTEVPDPGEGIGELLERKELSSQIQRMLMLVPFDQRHAVVLCDLYGYRYEEVAEMTGASSGTVKSRIHRGREKLRQLIAANPEQFPAGRR
ncbi:MAG: RNA polymerase sigma factor [Tepidiformaceae bacterium]